MIPFFYDRMSVRVIGNVKTYLIIYYLIRNSVETQTSALLFHMTWAQQSLHVTSDFWCSLGMPGHQWEWSCTVAMVMEKHFSAISCVNTKSFSKLFSETDYIQLCSCTLRWTHRIESSSQNRGLRHVFPTWHLLSLFSTNIRRRIVESM